MSAYWFAIDRKRKLEFEPPKEFAIKDPGFYHPSNPFPGMFLMMLREGFDIELVNDEWLEVDTEGFLDITEQVYVRYLKLFDGKPYSDFDENQWNATISAWKNES